MSLLTTPSSLVLAVLLVGPRVPQSHARLEPGIVCDDALRLSVELGETVEISLAELTKIKYEPGQPLPKKIQELDGKDVVITGFMHPDTGYDVESFLLVSEGCACGASPQPNHFVEVTLNGDRTSRKRGELTFRGTFSVGEVLDDDGFVESLFRLEGDYY